MKIGFQKAISAPRGSLDNSGGVSVVTSTGTGAGDSIMSRISKSGLSFRQMDMVYRMNPIVQTCIDRIVERCAGVKPVVKPASVDPNDIKKIPDSVKRDMDKLNEFIAFPSRRYTMTSIIKQVVRDVARFDAGSAEIVKDGSLDRPFSLYPVAGNTVLLNVNDNNMFKTPAYMQRIETRSSTDSKTGAKWDYDSLLYYMLNPVAGKVYGISPIETLVQTITADAYATQHNIDFFKNNATPRLAVLMEGLGLGQGATALQRIRKWWDNELQNNPHRPIILGTEQGKTTIVPIGMSQNDMDFQNFAMWLTLKIMMQFKLQPSILGIQLGDKLGKADAKEQERLFKKDAVRPQLDAFYENLNKMLVFNAKHYAIRSAYIGYDIGLDNLEELSKQHETYLRSGVMFINEVRLELGLSPVEWGNVPYLQNNVAPFGRGKNGAALPENSNEQSTPATAKGIPNVQDMTRAQLESYVSKDNGYPIGWEDMEITERIAIVKSILAKRENAINGKIYMIPNS